MSPGSAAGTLPCSTRPSPGAEHRHAGQTSFALDPHGFAFAIPLFLTVLLGAHVPSTEALRVPSRGSPAVAVLVALTEEPASHVFARVKAASVLPADEAAAAARKAAAAQARRVRQRQDRIIGTLKRSPRSDGSQVRSSTTLTAAGIGSRFCPGATR